MSSLLWDFNNFCISIVVTEHMLSVHWIRVQYVGGVQVGGSGGSIHVGASTLPRNNSLHSGLVNLNSLGREESVKSP